MFRMKFFLFLLACLAIEEAIGSPVRKDLYDSNVECVNGSIKKCTDNKEVHAGIYKALSKEVPTGPWADFTEFLKKLFGFPSTLDELYHGRIERGKHKIKECVDSHEKQWRAIFEKNCHPEKNKWTITREILQPVKDQLRACVITAFVNMKRNEIEW